MPPHNGHLHLVEFARRFAHELTIVVGSLAHEPIPGELRRRWMKELFQECRVVHLTDENPQYPEDHPDFWAIWRESLKRVAPEPLDYLFASEDYGQKLADVLDATFIPCNDMRGVIPVSGTMIRENPSAHWKWLPSVVKKYYGKKILIFGPESTGKTTLARTLAKELGGQWVPEYARTLLRGREDNFELSHMITIARGQWASEQALWSQNPPYLFCDTDPATTALWCRELFGEVPAEVEKLARESSYDLTLLLDVDVPWEEGTLRLRPDNRREFWKACKHKLVELNRPHLEISGSWNQRLAQAREAVLQCPHGR